MTSTTRAIWLAATITGSVLAQDAPKPRIVPAAARPAAVRPFGTLRDQAKRQQEWLRQRLDGTLPALMRKHGIDLWVVPMREYND